MKKVGDIEITKRFLDQFDIICAAKQLRQEDLAIEIGTSKNYISQLRKNKNPHIRPGVIAKLCAIHKVSASYILIGKEESGNDITEALKRIEKNQSDTISKLLEAIIEIKPSLGKVTLKLANEAKRRGN